MKGQKLYEKLISEYPTFIYEGFKIEEWEGKLKIQYDFEIVGLKKFHPTIEIESAYLKKELLKEVNNAVFELGLVEMISYWKATCSKEVIIKAGYLNKEQIQWFKDLYFYGLGELFYTNNIKVDKDSFMDIKVESDKVYQDKINQDKSGYLIPVGGGKDSCVTLEALKEKSDNLVLIVNPKKVMLDCAFKAGYKNEEIVKVKRVIDPELIRLNQQGFINGHTPFSAMLAFLAYFIADLTGKKYVAVSNESSANESNVVGEKINHQYSKSLEFENNFRAYQAKYLKRGVEYFSFLRPLSEIQIAQSFAKLKKYHSVFKSCNVGSKEKEWVWCTTCPKCLFVYIMLCSFLTKEEILAIFKEDMLNKKELLDMFIDLIGEGTTKPFECVGTFREVRFAIEKYINQNKEDLPFLAKYYQEHYYQNMKEDLLEEVNLEHNLTKEQEELLRGVR